MIKFILKILKFVPETVRLQFYRSQAEVPEFAMDSDFTIEIARSRDDLESAYELLHECYVATKLMSPHSSGLRCNIFSFLPHTTVIVAKYKNQVIGTVSLIRDSSWGLPSDKDYKTENNELRKANNQIVEVSALAVSKSYRKVGNSVSLLLMKYLYNYTRQYFSSNCLVCTVHPRAEDFYKAFWHFKRNGKQVSYQFVQGALAVHLSMQMSDQIQEKIVASYPSKEIHKNFALFVLNQDARFIYPERQSRSKIDPVLTPYLLEYFSVDRTDFWSTFSSQEQAQLICIYEGIFGTLNGKFKQVDLSLLKTAKEYRIPAEVTAMISVGDQMVMGRILDLSTGGAFVTWPKNLPELATEMTIKFKIGNQTVQLNCQSTWKNEGTSSLHASGFGIKFIENKKLEAHHIKNWIYSEPNVDFYESQQRKLA